MLARLPHVLLLSAPLFAMAKQPCISYLRALGDETRWQLVSELLAAPRTVSELVERLRQPQPNISKHLRVLRQAGIVETRKEGKHVHCSVAPDFRRQLRKGSSVLDLGCCTFQFGGAPK